MSKSPEEKISIPILGWFYNHATGYEFESELQFKGVLSDDKFKSLDLDKLWEIVGPHLKDLIKEYLEGYEGDAGEQLWRAQGE